MPVIAPSRLVELQSCAQNVRNVCILAHVDHGKTSLTDSLIATNGIISPKLAGKVRYLDSRPDEQTRGITMESSAISLLFAMTRRKSVPTLKSGAKADVTPTDTAGSSSASSGTTSSAQYLVNLIDSPGHIDFASEVSTASRLSDGAIVLVDAVEGVCSQTVTSLRQVWTEKLKPLLVINKIDRLITELKMSPTEAYSHLERVLEGVNAVIGGFFQGERMEEDLLWRERMEEKRGQKREGGTFDEHENSLEEGVEQQFEERDDEDLYFAPERHNVIFASAIDGWGFTVRQFAAIYEKKLAIKRAVLEKVLWGEFYLDPKTKKVLGAKHLRGRALKPLFVQLVLEPLWTIYEAAVGGEKGKGDQALLDKVIRSLSISLSPQVARSREPKTILQAVFAAWLPLSTAVLVSIVEYLPNPPDAQATRLSDILDQSPGAQAVSSAIRSAMVNFHQGVNAPAVAYVSKMVAMPESDLPASRKRTTGSSLTGDEARELARKKRAEIAKAQAEESKGENTFGAVTNGLDTVRIGEGVDQKPVLEQPEDPEHLIGFARLYSGSLSVGDEVYVLPPKFNPMCPQALSPQKVTVKALYLLMGRALESLHKVPAGVIFGIEGLDGYVLKNGTLCSQLEGAVNLAGTNMASQPIVRVALEPVNPADLTKMARGMRLLEQSDPCAVYEQLESGEHVIHTAGELHLERCLKDLRERFARCEIQAGEPIVPYRETIVQVEEMEPPKNKDLPRGTAFAVTASKQISASLRLRPLPAEVTEFLIKEDASIRRFYSDKTAAEQRKASKKTGLMEDGDSNVEVDDMGIAARGVLSISDFRKQLQAVFDQVEQDKEVWKNVVGNISAFGPKRVGPNLFVDMTGSNACGRFLEETEDKEGQETADRTDEKTDVESTITPTDFSDTILHAFQLATHQGPLCREPMQGVAVFLESVTVQRTDNTVTARTAAPDSNSTDSTPIPSNTDSARLTGELITSIRTAINTAFIDWSARILLAMYTCTIQATPEVLGRVYSVLSRRRGNILSESLLEGTPYFTITTTIPLAESFGFADELRKRTSGLAQPPVMLFSGYRVVDDVDPNWIPFSEVDLEDLGEFADRENVAKKYVDAVRRRKGLLVQGSRRGVGRDAEKQRNLKTN